MEKREREEARKREVEEEGEEGGCVHYAKQGLGSQSRQTEMRCQHCTGALMYECGEIKRVTRQTGGGLEKVKPAHRGRAAVHRRQGASKPPSLPPSITLPLWSFCCCCCCVALIYLFVCFCSSLTLLPVRCHGGGPQP